MLHPWAYDLDAVDMKYIVNNNLELQICEHLKASVNAQIFWLSFFKPQLSCSADEFFEGIRQLAELSNQSGYFAARIAAFESVMVECRYVISVEEHAPTICKIVDELLFSARINPLIVQFKTYTGEFQASITADSYQISTSPALNQFAGGSSPLAQLSLLEVAPFSQCDLQRKVMHVRSDSIPDHRLVLKFEAVDTEELKNIEIAVEGDRAIFKVGEGETSNYHIPNDKKLWETQFSVCCLNGQFYLRDMGFVHNSRVKLDAKVEVQIQKGSVVDLGKVVHYHFDKVVHARQPECKASERFFVLRPERENEVDLDDFPLIRARPVWVSADENEENIQNEIHVIADDQKCNNSLGRSMKRDIQIKLKAVSADHCCINYRAEAGWVITERGKASTDRLSSNGTYIFLKAQDQMSYHMPSDLIPVQNDMIISFVNYELRVKLEAKTPDEKAS